MGVAVFLAASLVTIMGSAASLEVQGGTIQVFALPVEIEIPALGALVDIEPESLELKSEGEHLMASILVASAQVHDIDLASVRLCVGSAPCGTLGVPATEPLWSQGARSLRVRFPRADVITLLAGIAPPTHVVFTLSGNVGGRTFAGRDGVRVVDPEPSPSEEPSP